MTKFLRSESAEKGLTPSEDRNTESQDCMKSDHVSSDSHIASMFQVQLEVDA
jgi:hypothetical protein